MNWGQCSLYISPQLSFRTPNSLSVNLICTRPTNAVHAWIVPLKAAAASDIPSSRLRGLRSRHFDATRALEKSTPEVDLLREQWLSGVQGRSIRSTNTLASKYTDPRSFLLVAKGSLVTCASARELSWKQIWRSDEYTESRDLRLDGL